MQRQVRTVLRAETRVADGVLALVDRARAGDEQRDSQRIVRFVQRLDLGSRIDADLAAHSEAYYADVARRVFASAESAKQGIALVTGILAREKESSAWLFASAERRHETLEQMRNTLVKSHADELVERTYAGIAPLTPAVGALIADHDYAALKLLHELFVEVDIVPQLRVHFLERVKELGMAIVQDRSKDDQMIERLIAFQSEVRRMLDECFASDEGFVFGVRTTFEAFINSRDTAPAELLAQFLDEKLRGGNKIMNDEQLEACLDDALTLFRSMRDKDMFEEFYKRSFAKRLLLNRSASSDAERALLVKLKSECGPDFTAKLETMLKDIEVSEDLMAAYSNHALAASNDFDFQVNVLTHAHWPTFPDTRVDLPPPLTSAMDKFQRFYNTAHSGRTLVWLHALGHMVLIANLGAAGVKELHISTFQAAVLFAFNDVRPDEHVSYSEILRRTALGTCRR